MKIRYLVWLLILGSTALLGAATYVADEQIPIATTAVGLTSGKINPNTGGGSQTPTMAVCRLESAEIRYRIVGPTLVPTAGGSGTLLEVGDVLVLQGHDIMQNFMAIRTGGTNGILDCTYYAP